MGYRLLRWLLGTIFGLLWRPSITGLEHVPTGGAVIVAGNHLSFIDSIVLPLAVPHRRVTFLAKSEYFTGGGLLGLPRRAFFTGMGAVPIARGEAKDTRAALTTALAVLEREWALGVYPEGTRSRDGRLYRGRTGIGWLALQSGAPVVPVGLIGTDKIQPIGARIPRLGRVQVHFGPPIRPEDYTALGAAAARRQLTDDVMTAIAELSGQQRAEGYNAHAVDA